MSGMTGRLRLAVGLDASGRCSLREQYAHQLHRVLRLVPGDAPEEGIVYLLNPTGGVVQGDDLEASVRVEAGAHAIVTQPSATKVYRSERAEAASRTRLDVASGATLEYLPEPLIPFGGARFTEVVEVRVAEGGRVLLWEIVTPGRAARGERFGYERLRLRLRVEEAGRLTLLERADARPAEGVDGPCVTAGRGWMGVLVSVGGDAVEIERRLRAVAGDAFAGVTRLPGTGVLMKALSGDARGIPALFREARQAILPLLSGRPATSLRTV